MDADDESYAGAAPERSATGGWRDLRRPLAVAGVLAASLFAVMAATGIGTGPGPLGDCCGYRVGISRDVGDSFTEGTMVLDNRSWFPIVVEDIRPLPSTGAARGLAVAAVELAHLPPPGSSEAIGMGEGDGSHVVPAERRHAVKGSVLQPEWRVGKDRTAQEVLVRYRLEQEGRWTYRGYELTYRSGLVRHRAVLDVTMTACAPAARIPVSDCDPAK